VLIRKRKKLIAYKAVVFDMDGTLYYQNRLRLLMAARLFFYYVCHPLKIKELLAVKEFRSVREHWDQIKEKSPEAHLLDEAQYAYVAAKIKLEADEVRSAVLKWIYKEPLSALWKSRDRKIAELIERLQAKGSRILVFSDYPAREKLEALGILADGIYSASDERLLELKPSPKGLRLIMEDYDLKPEELLLIGDRFSRDGMAAVNAGTDYLILKKTFAGRRQIYAKLFEEINA